MICARSRARSRETPSASADEIWAMLTEGIRRRGKRYQRTGREAVVRGGEKRTGGEAVVRGGEKRTGGEAVVRGGSVSLSRALTRRAYHVCSLSPSASMVFVPLVSPMLVTAVIMVTIVAPIIIGSCVRMTVIPIWVRVGVYRVRICVIPVVGIWVSVGRHWVRVYRRRNADTHSNVHTGLRLRRRYQDQQGQKCECWKADFPDHRFCP